MVELDGNFSDTWPGNYRPEAHRQDRS